MFPQPPTHVASLVLTTHFITIPSAGGNECEKSIVKENAESDVSEGMRPVEKVEVGGETVQYTESRRLVDEWDKEREKGVGVRGQERWCVVAKQRLITKSPSIVLALPCPPSRPESLILFLTYTHTRAVYVLTVNYSMKVLMFFEFKMMQKTQT